VQRINRQIEHTAVYSALYAVLLLAFLFALCLFGPERLWSQTLSSSSMLSSVSSSMSSSSSPSYSVLNLGTLGGNWAFPAAINDAGHVAGTAKLASGVEQPFLWNNSAGMRDLDAVSTDTSSAAGMNAFDQVVGGDTNSQHAFLWSASAGMLDLGTLGGCCSDALAINDQGAVVGSSVNGVGQAFVWTAATGMQALASGNGRFSNTAAAAINHGGFIVGAGDVVGSAYKSHALLWTPNGGVVDLGTLGGISGGADGINASNQVVGGSLTTSGETHPFVWSRTTGMQDLGLLSGYYSCTATAINDAGQVVGTCFPTVATAMPHAFLWTRAGGMQDLNELVGGSLDVTLGEATAINSRGQITVWAAENPRFSHGRAYVLTPQ
jgi:probable HAF family extracellular repeat protein